MTDLDFLLLKALYDSPDRTQEHKSLCESGVSDINTVADAIRDLVDENLIKVPIGTDKLALTKLGKKYYELEQKARSDASKTERDNKFSKRIAIISLILSALVTIERIVQWVLSSINK